MLWQLVFGALVSLAIVLVLRMSGNPDLVALLPKAIRRDDRAAVDAADAGLYGDTVLECHVHKRGNALSDRPWFCSDDGVLPATAAGLRVLDVRAQGPRHDGGGGDDYHDLDDCKIVISFEKVEGGDGGKEDDAAGGGGDWGGGRDPRRGEEDEEPQGDDGEDRDGGEDRVDDQDEDGGNTKGEL